MNEQFAGALAAEEAAIYAYGLIGVKLSAAAEITEARGAEQAHRERRDWLISKIAELKSSAGPAPAGYTLPFPVSDRESALELAIRIEDGVAQGWRPVLGVTQDADRATGLSALTDAAIRACRWRRIADVTPLTMAFPGKTIT